MPGGWGCVGEGKVEQSSGGERHETEETFLGLGWGTLSRGCRSTWSEEEGWLELQDCL